VNAELSDSTLSDYLRQVWEANRQDQPRAHRQRYRTPMWEFTRQAKAHKSLVGLDVLEAAATVENCLQSWGIFPDTVEIWRAGFPSSDDPREEFIYTWDRVKWPKPELDRAQVDATALPLKPQRCYSPGYERFISIAGHLQRGVQGSILLPCNKLSQILDCEPMAVSRYRKWAQENALLKLTRQGTKAQRMADEFIFAVELFDWKTGKQIPLEKLSECSPSREMLTRESDIERKQESQEKQEKQDNQDIQRETRTLLPMKRKCAIRSGPYIPTVAELDEQLKKLRRS
jgi:hypothetical protein